MPTALRTRVALRASVKEHSNYRGESQTLLTGVKVVADISTDRGQVDFSGAVLERALISET